MSWRDDKVEELESTVAGYLIELTAREPDDMPDHVDDDTAATVMITSSDERTTLIIRAGADIQGVGFATIQAFDVDGNPVVPHVFDAGESILVSAPVD